MTVYDCFPFFNENDLLELRLNQHWDYVDKFIIVESGETHTGLKKKFNFDHDRFRKYSSKIIYRKFNGFQEELNKFPWLLDDYAKLDRSRIGQYTYDWARDHFQGNYAIKVLLDIGAKDNDVVYISSIDEILNEKGFKKGLEMFSNNDMFLLKQGLHTQVTDHDGNNIYVRPAFGFSLDLYVYKFNLFCKSMPVAQMTEFSVIKNIFPSTMRSLSFCTHDNIPNAGWHFTYLDDTEGEKVLLKQKSWAHSKDSIPGQKIKFNISSTKEAIERMFLDYETKKVDITPETHPKYLIDNLEKYKNYIM
jgi:beta-1,4-mannosyl-glycoprotein beta-1,4-N-acetylglucosaminyltransferase